jgi:integrase
MNYKFPGLLPDKTAAGTRRWRVRVEGDRNKKIKIPVGPGEPSFHEHYAAARLGEKLATIKPSRPGRGTLDEMCVSFLDWMDAEIEAGNLSPLTKSGRKTGLTQACDVTDPVGDRIGSLDADLPREAFIRIRDSFKSRTGAAETCLKALRAAYKWGQERGYPQNSAVFAVKSTHKSKGGAIAWTAADVEGFLRNYGPGTMARLWFCLAHGTNGRISDAPTLGPENEIMHDGERFLEWQPKKAGSAFVSLPFDVMLAEELKNHDDRATYLVTEYGRPFASSGSLDNRVRKWIVAAGLVDAKGKANRSQHGIRKGVAESMAGNGATEYELMSSFGWVETKTAAVYTKKYQRRGAAKAAAERLSNNQSGPRDDIRGPQSTEYTSKIRGK